MFFMSTIWPRDSSGTLRLKEAYLIKSTPSTLMPWTKHIYNKDIPTFKDMIAWELMLGKLPTNDQLMYKGCNIAFVCSLCRSSSETLKHIFFPCSYARRLWIWLCRNINDNHSPSNFEDFLEDW